MADTNSNPAPINPNAAEAATEAARGKRKERVGEVPKFKKVVTGYKKLYAHDEKSEAKVGDRVRIEETRPLSKIKRWRLVEVVEKGSGVAPVSV